MRTRIASLILIALVVAACTTDVTPSTTTIVMNGTTTSTLAPTTTTVAPTTTVDTGPPVLPAALDHMPDTWVELFLIPYGETVDTLGTSLGGDGDGIFWGPEYGAQMADGTWWFLDSAKFRLAHFSAQGEYLDEIVLPESMLTGGIYFQYTMPRSLADGAFVASRFDLSETNFLVLRDGHLSDFNIPFEMSPATDDGQRIYGFSWDTDEIIAVDPLTRASGVVDWMTTRGGNRFRATGGIGGLVVELPDAGTAVDIDFEADQIGGPVYLTLEVISDVDGTLHVFMLGFPERDESLQLAGYLTITADGQVSPVEPIMDPFTPSDPAIPARLGVRPGTTDVTFMNIGVDGVRVYGRR